MSRRSSYSSRERLLCALSHSEPDRVPLWCLWRGDAKGMPFSSGDELSRLDAVLAMGMDDTLLLRPPGPREDELMPPDLLETVTTRVWTENGQRDDPRVLVKEYLTPDGPLRQAVRLSSDWPFGDDIPIFSDFNVVQGAEYPLKTGLDIQRLKHVLREPTPLQLREFRDRARRIRKVAREREVLVEGGWLTTVDAAVWLFGLDALLWKAIEDPGFVQDLLGFIGEWERPRLELLLEAQVDLVVHSAWYEMPHFWSPSLYRELILPVIAEEVRVTHSAGAHFCYILTAGSSLVLDDLAEVGVDSIRGVDPVLGHGDDLGLVKGRVANKIAIWGGMNAAVTLERGNAQEVRAAVDQAIGTCAAGGGFVLYPVDQIWSNTSWPNVETMVARWQEIGRYPIAFDDR